MEADDALSPIIAVCADGAEGSNRMGMVHAGFSTVETMRFDGAVDEENPRAAHEQEDFARYMEQSDDRARRVPRVVNLITSSLRDRGFMDSYEPGYFSASDLELIVSRAWIQAIVMCLVCGAPVVLLAIFSGLVLAYIGTLVAAIAASL